jgi:hypothetical protein
MTLPLGLLIPGVLGTYGTIKSVGEKIVGGDMHGALRRSIKHTIGYDIDAKKFNLGDAWFTLGWGSGMIVHKVVGCGRYGRREQGARRGEGALDQAVIPCLGMRMSAL